MLSKADILTEFKNRLNALDSDTYIEDDEGFIIDECYSSTKINKLLNEMIAEVQEKEDNL